ncbi:hypothetical protein BJ912DRAFT_1066783 [Pholiota molesta]|nr:hypothetical protein BJ912DRAFT_1066783 [Pholiota molesta]
MAGVIQTSAAPTQGCFIPPPENYTFQSVSFPGKIVRIGGAIAPNSDGFTLGLEKAPLQGNVGTFTLSSAEEGGFHILNVEEGLTLATLIESNLTLPEAAFTAPPSTYAIQCAGAGEFIIKAVDADLVWTTIPGTRVGDAQQGVATVEMLPADGSDAQRFLLNAL